jgi:hypothetical protein
VESLIANGVRDGYKKLPQILNAYLAAIAPAPASAPAAERQVSVGSDSDYGMLLYLQSMYQITFFSVKQRCSHPQLHGPHRMITVAV